MTLLFTWEQAQLCHKANAFLISPFVNRQSKYKLNEDPNYKFNYGTIKAMEVLRQMAYLNSKTIVMFASIREEEVLDCLSLNHVVRNEYPEYKTLLKITIPPQPLEYSDKTNFNN